MFGAPAAMPLLPADLFDVESDEVRNQLEGLFTPLRIGAGRVLIEEGGIGREFFVILDGTATVTRNGTVVGELGAGDHFGELALLAAERRNATVTATTEMRVLVANPREFRSLMRTSPRFAESVLALADKRRLPIAS